MMHDTAGDDSWHLVQMGIIERRLTAELPVAPEGGFYWMEKYADWLKEKGIHPGGPWPSSEFCDEANVSEFIAAYASPSLAEMLAVLETSGRGVAFYIRPYVDAGTCNVETYYYDEPSKGGVQSSMISAICAAYADLKATQVARTT